MRYEIDLNLDAAESAPRLADGTEAELYSLVSRINIACGGHAGDESTMQRAVELGLEKGVVIGAHPSFPDRDGFGRRKMEIKIPALVDSLCEQVFALSEVCKQASVSLHHLKPHGALYNLAATDQTYANAVIDCTKLVDPSLIVVGLAGSPFLQWCGQAGLSVLHEAFADRRYRADGQLVERTSENALLSSEEAADQALRIATEQFLFSADTICIHGDSPTALETARAVHGRLTDRGVKITSSD